MWRTVGRVVSWVIVILLILLVLGSVVAVGVVVAVRTDLFDLDAKLTTTEVEALWSFVAAGLAATVTLLVGVWTWSYTDPDQHLSAGCALVLSAVASSWPEDATRLSLGDRSVSAGEIRESLERSSTTNSAQPYRDLDAAARVLYVAWGLPEASPPAGS